MLTGQLPFRISPIHRRSASPELAQGLWERLGLGRDLTTLLGAALSVDPTQRPTAAELARALTHSATP